MSNFWSDFGDWIGFGSARRDREFQAEQAQIQRDYETQMSNTAVQRQAEDMEKAGVNTAMAFSSGASGASTPSGASAHGSSAGTASAGNTVGAVVNGAANMVKALNYDKNSHNDVNLKDTVKMLANVAKLFI